MDESPADPADHHEPTRYEFRIKGHLDAKWAAWFEGMIITREEHGETRLTSPALDQAALHGVLRQVRDLGMPLLSVMQIEPEPANGPEGNGDTDRHRLIE